MRSVTPAEGAIRETIVRHGPITFRQFMEMALYSAPGSYYATGTGQIGSSGDYFTSPEMHPAFGALVARQVEQLWVVMGTPEVFSLVEMGAGSGALARDILSYSAKHSPAFSQALEYVILERNPAFRSRQQQTLAEIGRAGERVAWRPPSPSFGRTGAVVQGCVVSNELLDAFPVHRVTVEDGVLREIYVDIQETRLTEVLAEPSEPRLTAYFDRLGFLPPAGSRVEVNLDALSWIRTVAGILKRGAVITIDYGYPARALYSERHMEGSLLCFYRHSITDNPYVRIGLQDITSHVDFTSLAIEGEAAGLRPLGLTTQREFLNSLGMARYVELLPALGLRRSDYEANVMALRELTDPNGLGRVKVLMQQRGLDSFEPAGLRTSGLRKEDLDRDVSLEPPPLLSRSHMRLDTTPNLDPFIETGGLWQEMMADDEEDEG